MRLPLPRSHGTAILYVDDPDAPVENPNDVIGIDIDTCDQATNPQCLLSGNYPATPNPGATQSNPARVAQCVTSPDTYYCKPNTTAVTDNSAVIAVYDGAPPAFALYDERNPYSGIILSYNGASAFVRDSFPCAGVDPATGLAPLRSMSLFLACDPTTNFTISSYTEGASCQYSIKGRSAFACGAMPPPPPSH